MSYATSPAKANHLFWLGRYAERVYTTLALLRSSRDGETDGNRGAVACCFARLGCPLEYGCTEEQAILRFLYDPELAGSLRQSLESAYENSIVLREDLSTESLSYIYLCRKHINALAEKKERNLFSLQPISDDMLAFWGAVAERLYEPLPLKITMLGKHVEYLDLHMRFRYPYARCKQAWKHLCSYMDKLDGLVDQDSFEQLGGFFREAFGEAVYPQNLISAVNTLVTV